MSIAVENAERRDAANEFPTFTPGGRDGHYAAKDAWRAREAEIRDQFERDLADEFAADLPEAVQDKIFERAWSDGHSEGYRRVAEAYEELAEFARFARNA